MSAQYYSLRWKGGDFRSDGHLDASENTVRIGQRHDCDVLLPNDGPYADELFAVIRPAKSADGWQIISNSEFVQTYVNGSPVCINHYLRSGDRISFSETSAEIIFEVRKGENTGTNRFTSMSRRLIALVACLAALSIGLSIYAIIHNSIMESRKRAALEQAKESVFKLTVDSVYYVSTIADTSVVLRRSRASGESGMVLVGSAFLSTDGLLITARHCIEPWLNDNRLFTSDFQHVSMPECVAWAIESETYNQTHDNDTVYRLVSRCTIEGPDGSLVGKYSSTDFKYDNSRDEIVETGGYDHVNYVRSITGRSNRSDMMLGDIAVLRMDGKTGTILIPDEKEMSRMLKDNAEFSFRGYSSEYNMSSQDTPDYGKGSLKKGYIPGQMIAHDGDITYGYSGSPALVVKNGHAYAVGVVSTYDANDKKDSDKVMHCCYSVPITEIKRIIGQ